MDIELDQKIMRMVNENLGNLEQVHKKNCIKSLLWVTENEADFCYRHPEVYDECDCPTIDAINRTYLEKYLQIKEQKKETSYRHIWITISLPADIDLEKMKNFDPNILNCSGTETMWVCEFYGKELKFHPHIHLLIRTSKKLDKKRIITKLVKRFSVARNFVDYEFSTSKLLFNKRCSYILHEKTQLKEAQMKSDDSFRILHGIKSYYIL